MTPRTPSNAKLSAFGISIFTEMTLLAVRHRAVNLGQGSPDFDAPEFVKEAAVEALRAGKNQYCRSYGLPELNRAIAATREQCYGLAYDPDREITVCAGATETICATLLGLLDPGDEVILLEPFYDSYRPCLALAGARERVVTLEPPYFALDAEALERAVTPRTRAILINTPHNPTGKIFDRIELEIVADLCHRHDLWAITDEVYEHLVFEGEHLPLASLAGMRERTVMISSAGKTFSVTGWKVGWACAPPALTEPIRAAHQFITFCNGTPLQAAIAAALSRLPEYLPRYLAGYRARRERLCAGLAAAGFGVIEPAGTYFVVADIRPLGCDDDVAFCQELPVKAGVAAIPVSALCVSPPRIRHLVRFGFCKSEAMLEEGIRRLQTL